MDWTDAMKSATVHQILLGSRPVVYRIVRSKAAARLRVRVGPNGVEVIQPVARDQRAVPAFLRRNEVWILEQLRRAEKLRDVRLADHRRPREILFRGEPVRLVIETTGTSGRSTSITQGNGEIVIRRGRGARTIMSRSLERWFRREARREIVRHLTAVTARLGREPGRVFVMGQRTKWGNCSARGNLSFNWRLILAPAAVLRYIVIHEAVHLAIPDHSAKFWLTVQSLCPGTERARQWLVRYQGQLTVDLETVLKGEVSPSMREQKRLSPSRRA